VTLERQREYVWFVRARCAHQEKKFKACQHQPLVDRTMAMILKRLRPVPV
jgi:hypothetical protein